MVSEIRKSRIARRIKEELSVLLIDDIADPRLQDVYITDVWVDRELAYANIYLSALEGVSRSHEVLSGFENAKGFIRRELSKRIQLRYFPQVRFFWDSTPERADHIEELLSIIKSDDTKVKVKHK